MAGHLGAATLLALLIVVYSTEDVTQQARRILQDNPIIDGHNDLSWNVQLETHGDIQQVNLMNNLSGYVWSDGQPAHTDIPRLKAGNVGAVFFSVFTYCNTQYRDGVEKALELISLLKQIFEQYSDHFMAATSVADIESAKNAGKIAGLMGIEGGHMLSSSPSVLRNMYELGVRYVTLTWNCNTPWADYSNPDGDENTPKNNGLTNWGKDLIVEFNRLGMLVDLSHVSPETMRDALTITRAPVIFSHSSAFALCPHRRNVPTDVLDMLADNKGIIMINFYNKFINCTEDNRYQPGFRSASISQVVDHMEFIRQTIGYEYIGLGSDFDGTEYTPDDLQSVEDFPNLVEELLLRNWPEMEIEAVVRENFLRVLSHVEQVRDEMQIELPFRRNIPAEDIPDLNCKNYPDWTPMQRNTGLEQFDEEIKNHFNFAPQIKLSTLAFIFLTLNILTILLT